MYFAKITDDNTIILAAAAAFSLLRCRFLQTLSEIRRNVKSREEFMKHQLLPSPPETAEIKRKASSRGVVGAIISCCGETKEKYGWRGREKKKIICFSKFFFEIFEAFV